MKILPIEKSAPTRDLAKSVARLRKKKNAVILAHYYQTGDLQDIADFVGDSLGLARQAANTQADIIVFVGVYFMAEIAKILNPEKKVLIPDLEAGCSLADNCPPVEFSEFISKHPGSCVITYVNSSAEVKALSDILCTSSNAEQIVKSVPSSQPIIFAPDRHLGNYLQKKTGRDMTLWQGACIVHETFDLKKIVKQKARHPNAKVIAHPECPEAILNQADHVGSTSSLLQFAIDDPAEEFIVVTESGILHQMEKACPEKTFHAAPTNNGCSCNECPYMRLNTMEKVYRCLDEETPEVQLPGDISARALKPLQRMLDLSTGIR